MNEMEISCNHRLEMDRARQKRWYDLHKADVSTKRKAKRAELKKSSEPESIPVVKPAKKGVFTEEVVVGLLNELDINHDTKKKYIEDVKALFRITECNNFVTCLNNFTQIKHYIENAKQKRDPTKPYSINSKKGFIQAIPYVIDKLHIPVKKGVHSKYVDLLETYKIMSGEHTKNKQDNPEFDVLPYSEYLGKIKTAFGEDSKQYLVAKLYDECMMRDNFGDLTIVGYVKEMTDNNQNYIVAPKTGLMRMYIQQYKTDAKYGVIQVKLSKCLSKMILKYTNGAKGALFPESKNGLSSFVGTMNRKVGIKGSINTLRQMKISEELRDANLTADEKQKLAKSCGHSHMAQLKYVRQLI